MDNTRYMISDTAKQVEVEAHVLRYWEEELDLDIARNEMGHRYYTEEDIMLFKNIRDLKEQGFQLKAIKMLIPDLKSREVEGMDNIIDLKDELNRRAYAEALRGENTQEIKKDSSYNLDEEIKYVLGKEETELFAPQEQQAFSLSESDEKMVQFETIISDIVTQALKENNKELGREISQYIGNHVIKEMDYLMRIREEREEERYKVLDETIRACQTTRKQIAVAREGKRKKIKRPNFIQRWRNKKNIDSFQQD